MIPLSPQIQTQESRPPSMVHPGTEAGSGIFKKKGAAASGGFAKLLQGLLSSAKTGPAEAGLPQEGAGTTAAEAKKASAADTGSNKKLSGRRNVAVVPDRGPALRSSPAGKSTFPGGDAADSVLPGNTAKAGDVSLVLRTAAGQGASAGAVSDANPSEELGETKRGIRDKKNSSDTPALNLAAAESGRQALAAGRASPGAAAKGDAKKGEAEEEGASKIESRRKDRRKDRFELEVHDLRTHRGETAAAAKGVEESAPDAPASIPETEITVELSSGSGDRTMENGLDKRGTTVSFQDALSRELRENAAADIVRHASLVLKDGGEGLIRLNLKPETLGTVKIRLEMADNKIAGSIIVESEEALRAFEKEIQALEQAFVDGGFDGASLELAVAADAGGDGRNREREAGPMPFFSERLAAADYDSAAPIYENVGRTAAVDMLA